MSDPSAQEPTMEEILASIRRIISEDDAPASESPATVAAPAEEQQAKAPHEEPKAATPAPAPPPVKLAAVAPLPVTHEEDEDDAVLDLTEPAPLPAETHGDLDVFDAEPAPKPKAPEPKAPEPKAPLPPETRTPELVAEPVKAAPAPDAPSSKPSSNGAGMDDERLISGGTEDRAASHFGLLSQSIAMPGVGRNLEDVVGELLKPLLKDWLDQHLPAIVEEKVQIEVERISRRRV